MKKSLVALAALAATAAFAQSTVSITGIMDANYSAIKNLGDQTTNLVGQNGARTTTFKFVGTEDLGGGLAANFQFEVQPLLIGSDGNKFNYTAQNTAAGRGANGAAQGPNQVSQQSGLTGKGMSFVGLSSKDMGQVRLGTINNQTFGAFAAVSQLGTGIGSGYGPGNTFGDFTRTESAYAYDTPTWNGLSAGFVKGVGVESQYGLQTSATGAIAANLRRPSITDIGLTYANGPLAVKYTQYKSVATPNEAAAAANLTTKIVMLGGVYDAGVAKLSYAQGSVRNDAAAAVDNKLSLYAVSVPFMGSYRAIYQKGTQKINGAGGNTGDKASTTGLALEKDLSKRTFVYLRNESTDLKGFTGTNYIVNGAFVGAANWGDTSSKRTVTAVGISHAF